MGTYSTLDLIYKGVYMESESDFRITFEESYGLYQISVDEVNKIMKDKVPCYRNISCKICTDTGSVFVRFSASESRHLNRVIKVFKKHFEPYIYTLPNQTLEEAFLETMIKSKAKVSVAESITGGLISSRIISVSGASKIIENGFVVYSDEAKANLLGIDPSYIEKYSAVSNEVAKEMMISLAQKTTSEVVITTTGLAGPGGGTENTPVGTVFFGIKVFDKQEVFHEVFSGDRESIRLKASAYALEKVIYLLRNEG